MRARLAGLLRRTADRLAPGGGVHRLSVTSTGAAYLDGREIEQRLNEYRRRRGLPGV